MSSQRIRMVIAVDGSMDAEVVQRLVSDVQGLAVTGIIDNDADWAARSAMDADVLVIACETTSEAVLELVAEEARDHPSHPVIVLGTSAPNGFLGQILGAGADDLVVMRDPNLAGAELYFAIQKAISRKSAPPVRAGDHRGELICVLGPKGGTGKTLTTTNLAVSLAMEGHSVAVVDLDLQFGDVGLVMGVHPERSIYDLISSGGSLDSEKLEAFLTPHSSGAKLLLAPPRPDQAAAVTPEFLKQVYRLMRETYDYVVVDTPPGFTPEVIATVDSASWICLIGTLDTPSLKNAKLGAETLELMGYPSDRIRVVLNRADTSVGVSHADVVNVLGRAPDALIPSHRDIVRSVNAGEPVVTAHPRSEAAKAFKALAKILVQAAGSESPKTPRSRSGLRNLTRS